MIAAECSLHNREELQDIPEGEIESNWDQVVDKCVALLCEQHYDY
jgi:hypothetical protein